MGNDHIGDFPPFSTEPMIMGGKVYQHEVPDFFHQHPGVWLRQGCGMPFASPSILATTKSSAERLGTREFGPTFRQISHMRSLSYWIEILKKVKRHNLQYIHLPPRKHESRCIYHIYIYCICIHVSICTYSYLPVSYICIHISIYTHMLIFLHFPHCQWQWKRPKVFFEQDGTQKDACKSELFHYDPNQPQKLHPHHRLLSPSVSPFILHLLSKGFVDGCQPGKRPHVFSTTDWYTTTDLWVLGMYYFFHLIHFGENCIHTPIYYVLNINIYIYIRIYFECIPVPPTVTTH